MHQNGPDDQFGFGEDLFKAVLDQSDGSVFLADEQNRYIYVNRAYSELTGYGKSELRGMTLSDMLPAGSDVPFLTGTDGPHSEFRTLELVKKDGSLFSAEIKIRPVEMAGQRFAAGFVSEISGPGRSGEPVAVNDDKFKYIFDHSHIGKSITHVSGEMEANRAFYRMLGYERHEFDPLTWQDVTHPDDVDLCRSIIEKLLSGQENTAQFVKRYLHKNGDVVWANVSTSLRRDDEGRPLYMMTAISDITDLKKKERIVRESEEKYRSLFDNMLNGFAYCRVMYDGEKPVDFIYLDVNAAFEKLTGLKNVVGKKVSQVIPNITRKDRALLEIYGRVALTGESQTFEIYLESLSMWFSISVYSPKKEYFVAVFNVITERKLAEIERQKEIQLLEIINAQSDLRVLMKSLVNFLHDLAGCEAVGIRLRDGDDFPYFETRGFSEAFVASETHLCVTDLYGQVLKDEMGSPVLECMCGNILCGRFDPAQPFFTDFGSFISNATTRLLADTSEADHRARTRNRCNGEGYESVFLVPLRVGRETFGLLQFNDYREGAFDGPVISQMERFAGNIAIALAQRRATDALYESEEKYRILFNRFPLGITISDAYGNVVETNDSAARLLGVSKDEHESRKIDDPLWTLIDQDGQRIGPYEYPSVRALKEDRWIENMEMGYVGSDKKITWLNVTAAPVPLEKYGVVVTYQDISDRKLIEDKYQTLFRKMIEGFALHEIICDDSGRPVDYRFLEVNPAFERMTGLNAEKIRGRRVLDIFPGTEQHWIETYGRVALSGEPVSFENFSSELGKHFQVTAFRPAPGQFACIFVDATQRKEAEHEIRQSKELFEKVFNSQTDSMLILNAEVPARVINANRATEEIFGYSKDELTGSDTSIVHVDEDHFKTFQKVVLQAIEKEGLLKHFTFEMKRKDGRIFPSEHTVLELKTQAGDRMGWIFMVRDLTEKKEMEERIFQAQKMESIGNLAGGIAHDFNNILFPIIGMSELLLEDLPPGSLEHGNAREILAAGKRGSELVKQILSFSRKTEHKKISVRLQQILKEVLKLSRATIPRDIDIQAEVLQTCGVVSADPTQIHQVAMNLITNAYHALGESGGKISIGLHEAQISTPDAGDMGVTPGLYAVLSVKDNGVGMETEVLNRIFEPYFTTKKHGKGTGLGLAVVYGIVREHQGNIRVVSEPGTGSKFSVFLPIVETTAAASMEDPAGGDLPGGTERLLLVDDEEAIATLEGLILSRLGYDVTITTSPREALRKITSDPGRFDLVISDMTMPEITGDLLAKRIIDHNPEMPILICTGFSERINEETAGSLGVKGILMKPVLKSKLARMVRKVLDHHAGRQDWSGD